MRRKIWSGAYLVFGTLLWTSAAAEDWPYTEASCNKEAHQLLVREKSAKREKDIPKRSGVQSLLALTKLKTINGPAGKQGHRVRKRDFWMECDLRESKYKVRISPWKFNTKLNGMCGGYSPSTELTVWRGNAILIDKLVFSGYCNSPDSDFSISSVSILDREKVAVISTHTLGKSSDQRIPFIELPKLHRLQLLQR